MKNRWVCIITDNKALWEKKGFRTRKGAEWYGRGMARLPIGKLPGFTWSIRRVEK